ncbi:MAG TPA: chemotaxis protein CheW [Cyanobacteria bacterium UBA8803]|nr:chemotaxis protein CheW [Cyanobacteria bacterium UBA9273]HBL60003.1 chemotaxis protein CheW [Cyanobacteria bacterium UBA8803]
MANDCWNQIGVAGDRSCGELKIVIHCRNCPIYSAAGRGLLEREVPEGYLQQWTDLLAQDGSAQLGYPSQGMRIESVQILSVVIFRIADEWLALPAQFFKEVTQPSVIHTLPHLSNQVFLGVVNIRGAILLCASLQALLDLETTAERERDRTINPVVYQRMVVLERQGNSWVFPVDEIHGVHRIHPDELREPPAVISKATATYTKWIVSWRNKTVNYLDDELLFYALDKKVL